MNLRSVAVTSSSSRTVSRLLSVLALSTALTPLGARAQSVPAVAVPSSAEQGQTPGDAGSQLEDIVVTAQRREQRVQDVPVAVSVFDEKTLAASGVANVKDLAFVEPSLNIQYSAGVYLPFLRGIGNAAAGTVGNESSVPVYIDDVYYTRLSSAYLAINSIRRVEVLKGPQGTLFGRNSSGGAVQIVTKDPGRDAEINASIGYANYDTISGQIYASTPITDTLAFNVALAGSDQRDGWGRSITTGQDAYREKFGTARAKLIWEPRSGTSFKLVGFYAYQKGDIGITQDRDRNSFGSSPQVPLPGYPNPPSVLPSLAPTGGFYDNRLNFRDYQREKGYGASLKLDQDIGFASLVSISAFRNSKGFGHYDSDYSAQNFYITDLGNSDKQVTQELQIKSKSESKIDWIAGFYYLHANQAYNPARVYGDLLSVAVAPGAVQNIFGKQVIDSYAGYGQLTAPLGPRTHVTVGLRYTSDDVTGSGRQTITIPGAGTFPAAPDFDDSRRFQRVTWKGAVDQRLAEDVLAYASVSRGYKSGTFNTLPLIAAPARAEIVDAYEVGIKSEFLDHKVRLNGAIFLNEIKDPQVVTFLSQGLTAGVGLTNAQKARVRGAEVGVDALVAKGLKLRGAATFLDGKFVRFTDAPFYALNGSTLTGPVRGDASGNRLPNVSRWRLDGGVNYTTDTSVGAIIADVSASYTSRFARNADNRVFQKAYTLVNASLSLTPSSIDWLTVGVWGKNMGGVKYYSVSQEFAGPLGIGGDITAAAPPRTYGGSVSVRF